MRGRVKSKQEQREEEKAAREVALSTAMDNSNKGFKMMAKLGYKPGETLGKSEDARTEPIQLSMKEDRGGVGLDSEKKRKILEELEHVTKRVKADESDYRERLRLEREEKQMEGQIIGAQKVLEKFDAETEARADADAVEDESGESAKIPPTKRTLKPLRSVNVLWRGQLRYQLEKERDRRMRYDLQQSLNRNPTYDDPDEDDYDKQALGKSDTYIDMFDDLDDEDPELEEFNALPLNERLEKLVMYLRQEYNYCFWCKHQYPDSSLDGCPGLTEEDHD